MSYELAYDDKPQPIVANISDASHIQICNGKFYDRGTNETPADMESGWTNFAGNSTNRYFYGINKGRLYLLGTGTDPYSVIQQIGTDDTWTQISGFCNSGQYEMYYYSYGINNDALYALHYNYDSEEVDAIKIDDSGKWVITTGYSHSEGYFWSYGIKDGKLYKLLGTTITQVGTDNTWTKVSWRGGNNSGSKEVLYAYGLNDNKLYSIFDTTATKISDETGWSVIKGFSNTSYNSKFSAFAINNGKLYGMLGNTIEQIGSDDTWTDIGDGDSDRKFLAINNGSLYRLEYDKTVTQINADTDWTACYGGIAYGGTYGRAVKNDVIYGCADKSSLSVLESRNHDIGWFLDKNSVNLQDYDLTVTGTPNVNDIIDLTYTTTEVPNAYVISDTTTKQGE